MSSDSPFEDLKNMVEGTELPPSSFTEVAALRTRLLNALVALGLSTGGLTAIANQRLLANISGAAAVPTATTLTALLDSIIGTTPGFTIQRGAATWGAIQSDVGCRIFNSANISIPNNTDTILTFDTDIYDTDAMHNPGVNPSRITFTSAGVYLVTGMCTFATNVVGVRAMNIFNNGTAVLATINQDAASTFQSSLIISSIFRFTAGEFSELNVFQNSGGALNVETTAIFSPIFCAQRLAA